MNLSLSRVLTLQSGSGASNTNTISTTDNSSRLSAASTAPSSTDISGREEWRSPHDKPFNDVPVPPIPKSTSPFSLKSASRSLSWGRTSLKSSTPPPTKELPAPHVEQDLPRARARAMTASTYASTATQSRFDEQDLALSLGGDFGNMFAGFDKRKSAVMLQQENNRAMSQSLVSKIRGSCHKDCNLTCVQETSPAGPTSRSYSSTRHNQPSPLNIDPNRHVEASPGSWSSQHSGDGLMLNSSPPPFAPRNEDLSLPIPRHTSPTSTRQQQPEAFTDAGLRSAGHRDSIVDYDEDARLLRDSVNASRKLNLPSYSPQVRDSWALPCDKPYKVDDTTVSTWSMGSTEATPRARKPVPKPQPQPQEDSLFDSHIAASADLAERFQEQPISPPTTYTPRNKVMTPAQFERYKQDQERLRNIGGQVDDEDEEEDEEEEHYDDDVGNAEKAKQLAKQRRKQEAHMAVYRQQMMKVTGDAAPAGISRPAVIATQSTPNLASLGKAEEGDEEDEEVPLAILQAHGFPNKNKPPMRSTGSNPNLRAPSMAGGVNGSLPVFARNLPQDPYFGAGIVNPAHRESMAFSGGASSVNGAAPSKGLPTGGLVGVIATEERSRAMRRGSPNPQGEYGSLPPPANGFNGLGMPPNPANLNGMGIGSMGMNPMMMMTPGDQAQLQMSQQMQQFMQMQMQFMQMMTSGQGPPQQQNGNMSPQFSGQLPTPGSPSPRPSSSHQRAMTMLDPNSVPWLPQGSSYASSIRNSGGGYAPSIAPSERSNIGLPGRYRPVSHVPAQENRSKTYSMSGALQGWENTNGTSTIKPVVNSGNISDEDDEEGWQDMAKKRENKKSSWRTRRETSGLKELLGFSPL